MYRVKWMFPLTVLLVLLPSVTSIAQQVSDSTALCSLPESATTTTDPLKIQEYILNQNQCLKQVLALRDEQLKAKDDRIKAKDDTIALRDQQLQLALSANKDRKDVDILGQERLSNCQESLARAEAKVYDYEHPRFFSFRGFFHPEQIQGVVKGYMLRLGQEKFQKFLNGQ